MRRCLEQHLSRFFWFEIPVCANARQYFHMPWRWVISETGTRECAPIFSSTYPDFFASRYRYARMRANIFTCPGDGLLVRPVRANARQYFQAPIQIFLLRETGTRECAPIFSSTHPDFFASRYRYARMRANIFTYPCDGLLVRPVRANAQVSRTAPIQIFLVRDTGTRECAPIFSHPLAMGY